MYRSILRASVDAFATHPEEKRGAKFAEWMFYDIWALLIAERERADGSS